MPSRAETETCEEKNTDINYIYDQTFYESSKKKGVGGHFLP